MPKSTAELEAAEAVHQRVRNIVIAAWMINRKRKREMNVDEWWKCQKCGYDIDPSRIALRLPPIRPAATGDLSRCPQCGHQAWSASSFKGFKAHWWKWVLGILFLLFLVK